MTLKVTLFLYLARNSEEFTGGEKSLPPLPPYHCHRIPFKNTFAAILMYFVNTTLKFSGILHGKLNST